MPALTSWTFSAAVVSDSACSETRSSTVDRLVSPRVFGPVLDHLDDGDEFVVLVYRRGAERDVALVAVLVLHHAGVSVEREPLLLDSRDVVLLVG